MKKKTIFRGGDMMYLKLQSVEEEEKTRNRKTGKSDDCFFKSLNWYFLHEYHENIALGKDEREISTINVK